MTRQLQRFLGSGDALARLHDHAARLRRLQDVVARELPPALAAGCSVANLKGETLILLAASGAVAVKLKQLAPTLVAQLAAAGVPLKSIQVKVQVQEGEPVTRPPTQRVISEAGRDSVGQLAATLPADSPLRASLERLIARSRSR